MQVPSSGRTQWEGNLAAQRREAERQARAEPVGIARMLGGKARHERAVTEATVRFDAATEAHRRAEADRKRALAEALAAHDQQVAADKQRIGKIRERQAAFMAGDPEAVEWFVAACSTRPVTPRVPARVSGRLPPGEPRCRRGVRAAAAEGRTGHPRLALVQRHATSWSRCRDRRAEVRQRYKRLIACVALRTLHEIFTATPPEVVEAVVFNGRLKHHDRATGKPERPHLLSVSAERSVFEDLVLDAVEPAACLTRLNALVSPNPYDLEAVEPFIAFDLKRFRFTDDLEVVAGLDSRPNLLKLTPTEFEHLVQAALRCYGRRGLDHYPVEGRRRRRCRNQQAPVLRRRLSDSGQAVDRPGRTWNRCTPSRE